jgi:hypothetical protein
MKSAAFRAASEALKDFPTDSPPDAYGRPKVVGVIGGEPLLHPRLTHLCEIMREVIPQRNHRGLWTGLDWEKNHYADVIRKTFGYVNENFHSDEHPSFHQPVLVAIKDVIHDSDAMWRYIDQCWVQRVWSSTITPRGFYFCEVAAALSGVLHGPEGLAVDVSCWKRRLADFRYQIDWACPRCGCALPLPARRDSEERDDVSSTNLHDLVNIRSPGLTRLEWFNADRYKPPEEPWEPNRYLKDGSAAWREIPPPVAERRGIPITPDVSSDKPLPLSDVRALTVCVDYGDILKLTLPTMLRHFKEVWVVTYLDDQKTLALEQDRVHIYATDAFYRNGADFNKGLAIEECFDAMGRYGWMCVIDSDIALPEQLPEMRLDRTRLYGCRRRVYPDTDSIPPESEWETYPINKDTEICGYFQLFHADDPRLSGRPWYGITWSHAGGCDSEFQSTWLWKEREHLEFCALHIGNIDANWHGLGNAEGYDRMRNKWTLRKHFSCMYEYVGGTVAAFRSVMEIEPVPVREKYRKCAACEHFRVTWCWEECPGPGGGTERYLRRLRGGSCQRW